VNKKRKKEKKRKRKVKKENESTLREDHYSRQQITTPRPLRLSAASALKKF
jgi:hypothetical protein